VNFLLKYFKLSSTLEYCIYLIVKKETTASYNQTMTTKLKENKHTDFKNKKKKLKMNCKKQLKLTLTSSQIKSKSASVCCMMHLLL